MDANDIAELLAICKGSAQAVPLNASHVRDPSTGDAIVTLAQLHGLDHVNALAAGEKLSFGKSGVTIIYGDNGAGKSGYARVLKQVCRARSQRGETILPNIYAAGSGIPKATIDFHVGGQKRSVAWTLGQATEPMLSAVSVFDSRTANVHVENTNELAYTPLPLKILAVLAQTCQDLKAKLSAEVRALEAQQPAILLSPKCAPTSATGRLIARLSAATAPETVEQLAGLSPDDQARLASLRLDLASDPKRAAERILSICERLDAFVVRLRALHAAAGEETATGLTNAFRTLTTARAAAAAASTALFAKEPLPDVGSDVWRQLWEAARAYSLQSAYPDQAFPVVGDDARCVLCQQELDEAASGRLSRFEAFVRDESRRREADAQSAYDTGLKVFAASRISTKDLRALQILLRTDLGDTELAVTLRRQSLMAMWRLRAIFRDHAGPSPQLPPPDTMSFEKLATARGDLVQRAQALVAANDSPERAALIRAHDELAGREWLAVVKPDVLAHIQRLSTIASLTRAIAQTTTNRITSKSTELAPDLVTNRLRGRFAAEVDKLGVAGLAIELQQTKTAAGVPYFQVRLVHKPSEAVGRVLSEGEHRCVALAAFLAELATLDSPSGIVFDDPVSSLDHQHREKVAARLAEEGQLRQVVVFTHDVAFLLLLDEACRDTKLPQPTPVSYRLVSRGPDAAGFCYPEPPAAVMPLDNVLRAMRTHLDNVSILYKRGDQAQWLREVKSFQEQLRETWERAVEEVVGPVVRRLARKVHTGGLIKLTVLTLADCAAMRDAFGRCSELLHSQPGELNPPLPPPEAVGAEINALAGWLADIRARQAAAA